ncbi:centrosomal protein of 170 kDa protein B [Trichomycterus rosablanca]|uniref:centrosomal protein of 170 kDa protein B n=1 Tax=Trichomycterus rosablanca TaxID=2290929 RepID=UPI002F354D21
MSVTSWFLVSSSGTRHRLPREMIFVGREDCELMLQSRSVDKQHAVINYDPATDEHLVKDLGSLNGTFVNDLRIPDQTYITLKLSDVVRFGYDSHVYIMEQSQHKVPEEALKHEKYTSQLQMGMNSVEIRKQEQLDEKSRPGESAHSKQEKNERKSNTEAPVFKPTPLYGKPSWWGDADEDKGKSSESTANHTATEKQREDSVQENIIPSSEHQEISAFPSRKDASYFEISTKELQSRPKNSEQEIQVIPTKDTDNKAPPTPPVVQSHASFTIEFDDCTPGKIKIKDHVTKFSIRQHKNPSKDSVATPTEVLSAESKVADWLVQSDTSMMGVKSRSGDLYSTESDLCTNNNLRDGLQSDLENPASHSEELLTEPIPLRILTPPEREEPPMSSTPRQSQAKKEPQQAYVIEFLDEDMSMKHSQPFSNHTSPPESHAVSRRRSEKARSLVQSGEQSVSSYHTPTHRYTRGLDGPQRATSLRREKSDLEASTLNFSSRSATSKPFGSVGRKSRLAMDFVAEFLKNNPTATSEKPSSSQGSLELLLTSTPAGSTDIKTHSSRQEEEDSLSDAGTYTIETEGLDKEVDEARKMIDQVQSTSLTTGSTKWVSRWASLADGYSDSKSGLTDNPGQTDLSVPQSTLNQNHNSTELESDQMSRARRILPQLPSRENTMENPPSIHIQSDSYLTYDDVNKNMHGSLQKEDRQKLYVQADLDPDSLSDASRSDDGSVIERSRKSGTGRTENAHSEVKTKTISKQEVQSAYHEDVTDSDQGFTTKFSTSTLTRQYGRHKSGRSDRDDSAGMENSASLIRQESYTKPRSSDDIHYMKLPHISGSESSNNAKAFEGVGNHDTQSYLKETENVLAALESKLQEQKYDQSPCPREESISGESDVDTSSTVSQPSGKNVSKKPTIHTDLLKEKKTASQRAQVPNSFQSPGDSGRSCQLRLFTGKQESQDNEPPNSRIHHWSGGMSDQESSSRPVTRKYTIPLQKDGSSRSTKSSVSQALARSNSLSAPKPTRTSMLRRARLGDASDNDGTETDRTSQNSDGNPSSNRPQETKGLSRLDRLALPRRRTGSFTTPSDSESSAVKTGYSNRSSAESGFPVRKSSVSEIKTGVQKGPGMTGRQPIIRGRSSSAKYASSTASSRRRQKSSDYASTSDEDYESNYSTAKHKRSHHSGVLNTSKTHTSDLGRPPSRARDSEGEGHESDTFQNWTSHSAEIARLSQDLAKDLAILAQEIHNVAGDAETPNSSSADAIKPATSACEEVQHQIPETNSYLKVSQSSTMPRGPDQMIHDHSLRQQIRNQDQAALDNSMLNPVSQLSMAIKDNAEQLTEKIKLLFHNKAESLDEIEAMINAADDSPPLESPSKEIMTIMRNLKGIQKRLDVINTIIEPSGNQNPTRSVPASASSSVGVSSLRSSLRNWRVSSSQRSVGPSASSRRVR